MNSAHPLAVSRELRRLGESTRALERDTASLVRIRPGVYAASEIWSDASREERHLAAVDALLRTSKRPPLFARESAALLHGLELLLVPMAPQVILDPHSTHRPRVGVEAVRTLVDPIALESRRDHQVTTPVRTVIDIAAHRELAAGVAAIDAFYRAGGGREEIEEYLEGRVFRGVRQVRLAVELSSELSESVLESVSMTRFHELHIPRPAQQVAVEVGGRRYRVDMVWPDRSVAGEADGRSKYLGADDLWREKRREDDLRSVFRAVVRWGADDAWRGAPLAERLARAGVVPSRFH